MPPTTDAWTNEVMKMMFTIHIHALTAFQLCKEAHRGDLKGAPFTLANVSVLTPNGAETLKLPISTSIKRTAMADSIATIAKLPGSVRKAPPFKKAVSEFYKSLPNNFLYKIEIKTNSTRRLSALTSPVIDYPARKTVENLRHVDVVSITTEGIYYGYLSILLQARLINQLPEKPTHINMTASVAQARRVLSATNISIPQVLTDVKSALLNTDVKADAGLVALLEALPTVRSSSGIEGLKQVLLSPQPIYEAASSIARIIGTLDIKSLVYLMT